MDSLPKAHFVLKSLRNKGDLTVAFHYLKKGLIKKKENDSLHRQRVIG